jgi:hypothetical protein
MTRKRFKRIGCSFLSSTPAFINLLRQLGKQSLTRITHGFHIFPLKHTGKRRALTEKSVSPDYKTIAAVQCAWFVFLAPEPPSGALRGGVCFALRAAITLAAEVVSLYRNFRRESE